MFSFLGGKSGKKSKGLGIGKAIGGVFKGIVSTFLGGSIIIKIVMAVVGLVGAFFLVKAGSKIMKSIKAVIKAITGFFKGIITFIKNPIVLMIIVALILLIIIFIIIKKRKAKKSKSFISGSGNPTGNSAGHSTNIYIGQPPMNNDNKSGNGKFKWDE